MFSAPLNLLFIGFCLIYMSCVYLQDWNEFLSGFRNVQFCMVTNKANISSDSDETGHIGEKPVKDIVSDVHSKLKGDATTQGTTSPPGSDIV